MAVEVEQLGFGYPGEPAAFSGLSLSVPRGSVFGLLGANGVGKSTLLKLLVGLLQPASGRVRLLGQAPGQAVFSRVGLMIESPNLYPHLSGRANLEVMATYRRLPRQRVAESLEAVGLQQAGEKQARHYSTGMKQRLGIAMALLHGPELLLLDEPVNGLDPSGIVAIRRLIRRLNEERGMTILLSSHLLGEVEQSCSHVGILAPGRLAYQGPLGQLRKMNQQGLYLRLDCPEAGRAQELLLKNGWAAELGEDREIRFPVSEKSEISRAIDCLREAGIELHQVLIEEDSLEAFYLNLYR